MQRYHRYFKIFLLALLCVSLLQVGGWLLAGGRVPSASAHAFVIGSDPVDGSTVSKAPQVVRIYFDAPIGSASQARVYAFPPGASASGLLVNAGQSRVNASNPRELDTALLPANKLPQGGYEVRWSALSLTDGHTTSGLIGFNLGQSSLGVVGTPTLGPSTSNYFPQLTLQGALAVAWDWLVLLALFFWAGIVITDCFLMPHSASAAFLTRARKHSISLQTLCLAALLVGEAINLVLRATTLSSTLGDDSFSLDVLGQLALHTTYGRLWLVRFGLLGLALLLLGWKSYHQRLSGDISTTSRSSRKSKRFRQLRQQARPELEPFARPAPTPLPARSQARVSGAVAVPAPARGTTAALPRITKPIAVPSHEPDVWRMVVTLALIGLVLLTLVLSNEITQLTALPLSTGVLAWLGLAAQGIWFGCMAYPGMALLPLLPETDRDHHAETAVRLLKCALPWLLATPGVLLVSELFLSEITLQAPDQFLSTAYGRALLVRLSLFVLMLIFTGYTLFFLTPRLQRQSVLLPVVDAEMPARRTRKFALEKTERTIRRALTALSGMAATSLICLALMNFFAPPVVFPNVDYSALVNATPVPSSTPQAPASQTQQVGNLSATLQVAPARVGVSNTVQLTLSDAQGKPVTDATVKLSINMEIMDMGVAKVTVPGGNAVYRATFTPTQTFTMGGPWTIQVEINRANQPPVQMTFQVLVAQ